MKNIESKIALKLIKEGQTLRNVEISDKLDLSKLEIKSNYEVNEKISIIDCKIEYLMVHSSTFLEKIELKNCKINTAYFGGGYFPKGFEMKDCKFSSSVSFEAGGHNLKTDFIIENNLFKGFVDFLDCWFKGPFILKNNVFEVGSNIFVEDTQESSTFDDTIILQNNIGDLKQKRSNNQV